MNIDPRNNASHIYSQNLGKLSQNGAEAPKANAGEETSAAASGDTLKLSALEKLRSIPEVRPEMVAKGKELLNDPNFPSKEMVNEMAKLIVPFADEE